MCGISGIINFKNKPLPSLVDEMNNSIKYRGPDHQAVWSNEFCSSGIVRLKILDLSNNSNQPFLDNERKISIIYNGEIYNFKSLKEKYFYDQKFKSGGDGEIILFLYRKFGISFIEKLKGMFSIFICDTKEKKTYLIRDRFGIKPLYYHYNNKNNQLSFCSEIKGLFQIPDIEKSINFSEINKILSLGLIDSNDETAFKNIFKVPHSSFLEFSPSGVKIKKYYKLKDFVNEDLDNSSVTFKDVTRNLRDKIKNSFIEHTNFDVKGGIHMSGGCDSAIMAALSLETKKDLTSYTFDFEDKKFSEVEEAKKIARSVNLKNEVGLMKDNDLLDNLMKVLEIQYEPFSSLRILSQNSLYEKYRDETKVILDGSGGDEIGAGYRWHIVPWYIDMLGKNTKKLETRLSKTIGKHETLSQEKFFLGAMLSYLKPGSATQDGSVFLKDGLLNKDFLKKYETDISWIERPFKSHLRNAQYLDFSYSKLPRSLRYTDRNSMRNSVEARLPFLDHEIVETCFSIPSKFKFLSGQDRIILKSIFKDKVDKKVLLKNKRTIADPQSKWLKTVLLKFTKETISDKNFVSKDIIDNHELSKLLTNLENSKSHFNSSFLIRLLMVEWWHKYILKAA